MQTDREIRLAEGRRTRTTLAVMFTVFVVAALLLEVLLPMGLDTREALIGMDGGIGALTLTDGTAHLVLEAPPKGEGYAAWGLSPGRDRFVDVWYKTTGEKVEKASIQIRSASSSRLRMEYAFEPGPEFLDTVQVGYVPGEAALWLLDSGRLSFLEYKTGELTEVTLKGSKELLRMESVCFSPDEQRLAYVRMVDSRPVLMIGSISGTVISSVYQVDPGGFPNATGPFTWVNRSTILVVCGDDPSGGVTLQKVVPQGPGNETWTRILGPLTPDVIDFEVMSISAAPSTKGWALMVRSGDIVSVGIDWNDRPDPKPVILDFGPPRAPLRWAFF
ncbi:MAG: hypothetical protein V1748_04310 [Actinomycetota bacterium]